MQAFTPLLEMNRSEIEGIAKKTFKYGSTDRHHVCVVIFNTVSDGHNVYPFTQLDVYYPPALTFPNDKPPILIFHYGGAFYSGERSFPPPRDLVYTNLGAFFASRGILTVIPDYRLVPNSTFPNPAEDSAAALHWIVENLSEIGDTDRVVLMGHSAGACIAATVLLHEPDLLGEGIRQRIKGAVLVGGAYHHGGPPSAPPDIITSYYGTPEQRVVREPIALLRNASQETITSVPRLLLLVSEKDAEGITLAHNDFVSAANERLKSRVEAGVAKGHNHISVNWALGTGQGEEWAEDVVKWVKEIN